MMIKIERYSRVPKIVVGRFVHWRFSSCCRLSIWTGITLPIRAEEVEMTNSQEKRQTNRYPIEVPILCSLFNFNIPNSANSSAKTTNLSRDGMHFVSDMEFHPGSAVLIRSNHDSPHQKILENTEGVRLHQTATAEVRWCKQVSENPSLYGVGVKYYESCY
jgi:hypothetical protein